MSETITTFCPTCDREVEAALSHGIGRLRVRGEVVEYDEHVATCPACGSQIGDSRVESDNLGRAYATYRAAHNVVTPDELRALRAAYGLSTREFSRFLGFGDQTEHRYEAGALPERAHNAIIRSAMTPAGALALLAENGGRISARSADAVRAYAAEMQAGDDPSFVTIPLYDPSALSPCAANGFREWDMGRIRELAVLLAEGCDRLFVTKFQKAMFFADSLSYERNARSLTGLTYAHGYYGPMINCRDAVMYSLRQSGAVELVPLGDGEVLRALVQPSGLFSPEEAEVVDEVVRFVNSFSSATALSDYSHTLSAWADTTNGDVVDYTLNLGEVSKAVERRLARA